MICLSPGDIVIERVTLFVMVFFLVSAVHACAWNMGSRAQLAVQITYVFVNEPCRI